ncbi:MAG TPA: hypothetical protein VFI75_02095 [Candidatus Acidoferrum sp.]|nr:hypothetical protein [Candidatus Acidoferrum sp.]
MPDKYRFTVEEKAALLRELKKILRNNDEREFMKVLRKLGIKDEDSRFAEAVKFFRDLRAGKA